MPLTSANKSSIFWILACLLFILLLEISRREEFVISFEVWRSSLPNIKTYHLILSRESELLFSDLSIRSKGSFDWLFRNVHSDPLRQCLKTSSCPGRLPLLDSSISFIKMKIFSLEASEKILASLGSIWSLQFASKFDRRMKREQQEIFEDC